MIKREEMINSIEKYHWDLIIIGGGITGSTILWEATTRGLKAILIEKKDFGWATTSATSKLIHGGLRYLKNLEFGLVRESLRERRILEIIAPHLVYPIPFLIPTYSHSSNNIIAISLGMLIYDLLSFDKGDIEDPSRRIPHYSIITKEETLELEDIIPEEDLTGGAIYYDCQVYSPERLNLSFILSSIQLGGYAINYMEAIDLIKKENIIKGIKARDLITNQEFSIKGELVINASGPWADYILEILNIGDPHKIKRSKGIHIITKPIVKKYAVIFQTISKRHFFVIPWRNFSLIGTTDTEYTGSPDNFRVTKKDIEDFVKEINESNPKLGIKSQDILFAYGGLRPLTDTEQDTYKASRKAEIIDHEKEDIKGLMTIIGGKYTTSRGLAEKVIDKAIKKLEKSHISSKTSHLSLKGGNISNFEGFLEELYSKYNFLPKKVIKHLAHSYGTEIYKILDIAREDKKYKKIITDSMEDIYAEVSYSITEEMAITLEDFVFRRSSIGEGGKLPTKTLEELSSYFQKYYEWDRKRKNQEIERILEKYDFS